MHGFSAYDGYIFTVLSAVEMAQEQLRKDVEELSSGIEILMAAPKEMHELASVQRSSEFGEHTVMVDERPKEWKEMEPELRWIYGNIVGIRNKLKRMTESSKPHVMEDIRKYQQMLDSIDSRRTDGIFGGSLQSGNVPAGQAVCSEVLDEAYDLLDDLIESSQEFEPSIAAVQSMLAGIARRLEKFKNEEFTWEDLRLYEQMLNAIDMKRVDGVFCGSPSTMVPEGQGTCADLLANCYELVEELKISALDMEPFMQHLHDKLLDAREQLREIKRVPEMYNLPDVQDIEEELDFVEQSKFEGVYGGHKENIPPGQHVISKLLKDCRKLVRQSERHYEEDALKRRKEDKFPKTPLSQMEKPPEWSQMDRKMRKQYAVLVSIRNHLNEVLRNGMKLEENDRKWFEEKLKMIDSQRRKSTLAFKERRRGVPAGIDACHRVINDAFWIMSKLLHPTTGENDDNRIAKLHSELTRIESCLNHLKDTEMPTQEEISYFDQRLFRIGNTKFRLPVSGTPSRIQPSDELVCCAELLESCQNTVSKLKEKKIGEMDSSLKLIFEKLKGIQEILSVYRNMATDQIPREDLNELEKQFDTIKVQEREFIGRNLAGFSTIEEMIHDLGTDIEEICKSIEE